MARPVEKPLKLEGKYTYVRYGNEQLAFASEVVKKDELEVFSAINHAFDRNTAMFISKEQHDRIQKILRDYNTFR